MSSDALRATREAPSGAQCAQFLRNYDELDLGRLSEEQRERVFAKFGPEERMWLYDRGFRRRLASMSGNLGQIELAYSLLYSLPDAPVIRYGDEIGMGDDLNLTERNSLFLLTVVIRLALRDRIARRSGKSSSVSKTRIPALTRRLPGK